MKLFNYFFQFYFFSVLFSFSFIFCSSIVQAGETCVSTLAELQTLIIPDRLKKFPLYVGFSGLGSRVETRLFSNDNGSGLRMQTYMSIPFKTKENTVDIKELCLQENNKLTIKFVNSQADHVPIEFEKKGDAQRLKVGGHDFYMSDREKFIAYEKEFLQKNPKYKAEKSENSGATNAP